MSHLLNGMTTRTRQAVFRDRAHGELLIRMQRVCKKTGTTLYSDSFADDYLKSCITRDYLHHVLSGRKRLSPDRYKTVHSRLTATEIALGLRPGNMIPWWEIRD